MRYRASYSLISAFSALFLDQLSNRGKLSFQDWSELVPKEESAQLPLADRCSKQLEH